MSARGIVTASSECRDVLGAGKREWLANETRDPLTGVEQNAADCERRRHRRDESTAVVFGYGPDFYPDLNSGAVLHSHDQ